MKINSIRFGHIVIEGKEYASDVIIYHDRVDASWSRKEGHRLQPGDLTEALNAQPDLLIIGTGHAGVLTVPKEIATHLASLGIEVMAEKTPKAVELYNSFLGTKTYAIAALHITC
jgi:hypothetical protein